MSIGRVEQPMSDHLSALLFLVSKQNLNLSHWHIWCIKNRQKNIRIEKVMAPQSKGSKKLKETNHWTIQSPFSIAQKKFLGCCFVAIREFKIHFYNWRWHSYSTLNSLKWTRNEKVRSFESRRGPKRRKKKTHFYELESSFFFLLFFHYSFSFALQRWFLNFQVAFS